MSQNSVLKKSDILKGQEKTKKIEVKSLGGSIFIRALSDGEATQIQEKVMEGSSPSQEDEDKVKFDPQVAIRNSREARYMLVASGLSNKDNDEEWSPEDVGRLKREIIEEIADKVIEYSGLSSSPTFRLWRSVEEEANKIEQEEAAKIRREESKIRGEAAKVGGK